MGAKGVFREKCQQGRGGLVEIWCLGLAWQERSWKQTEREKEGKCRRVKWQASVKHWGRNRDVLRAPNEISLWEPRWVSSYFSSPLLSHTLMCVLYDQQTKIRDQRDCNLQRASHRWWRSTRKQKIRQISYKPIANTMICHNNWRPTWVVSYLLKNGAQRGVDVFK